MIAHNENNGDDKKRKRTPTETAIKPGKGGIVPPVAHQFQPGNPGGPGRPPGAGATVKEWLNIMAEWPLAKVSKAYTDPDAPAAKVMAARVVMDACESGGGNFDRVMDRTDGKPQQALDVTTAGQPIIEVLYRNRPQRVFDADD